MTYTVLHANGERYGPATVDDLRIWMRDGRIDSNMLVEDENGTQLRVREIEGFTAESVPPRLAAASSVPLSPSGSAGGGTSWVVPAIVGCVAILVIGLAAVSMVSSWLMQRRPLIVAQRAQTLTNAKQLALGLIMYSSDNDDRLPLHMETMDAAKPVLMPYVKSEDVFRSLNPAGALFLGDRRLAGKKITDLKEPWTTPMLWESLAWPDGKRTVGYADGHVKREDDSVFRSRLRR